MGGVHRKKKRWRRVVIGGIASLILAGAVFALGQVSGRESAVSGAGADATGLDATGIAYRWGTFDATSIRSWDATQ
jgi:hypothetical protein